MIITKMIMEDLVARLHDGLPEGYQVQAETHCDLPSLESMARARLEDLRQNYGQISIKGPRYMDRPYSDSLFLQIRYDHIKAAGMGLRQQHYEYADPAFPENLLGTVFAVYEAVL